MATAGDMDIEMDVDELVAALASGVGVELIDVREPDEQLQGVIDGARLLPLADLARSAPVAAGEGVRHIVAYCASGQRSAVAARQLRAMGFAAACSLRGGLREWLRRGHALSPATGAAALAPQQIERYSRHLRLPEVGLAGQRRLLAARVLCIGAGGLGSPACLYLAAAGVGTIGIVDDDRVELSNLQRQILHDHARVGRPKVHSAAQSLGALNPDVVIHPIEVRLDRDNAAALLADYDLVIDGSDNLATRYVVNDIAMPLRKPVVFGAVLRFEGQVSLFEGRPCYRCLFPEPPPRELAPSCAEAGVLGVLPGIIGSLQAAEAIKWLLGVGRSLAGRLLVFDALSMQFNELQLAPDPACPICAVQAADR